MKITHPRKQARFAAASSAAVLAIVASLSIAAGPGRAAQLDETRHPVDARLKTCEEKNPSTAGTLDCVKEAALAWDKELNSAYRMLAAEIGDGGRESLRAAQRDWIRYRDQESRLVDAIYSKLQGTMYLSMSEYRRMNIVRERALELRQYLRLLKEHR